MKRFITITLLSLLTQFSFSQTHITLVYNGNNENVGEAVKKANEILNSKHFYDEIRKIEKFDNSKLTGQEIADRMEKANQKITVVRKLNQLPTLVQQQATK